MDNLEILDDIVVGGDEILINAEEFADTIGQIIYNEENEATCSVDEDLEKLKSLLNDFNLMQLFPILQGK